MKPQEHYCLEDIVTRVNGGDYIPIGETRYDDEAYERQNGICPICKQHFDIDEMEGDHIDPWHDGGKTSTENCQMLCKPCNRRKSGK